MKRISVLNISKTNHLDEIYNGFLKYKSKKYSFFKYEDGANFNNLLILGAHSNPDYLNKLRVDKKKIIIYNLEQLIGSYKTLTKKYINILREYRVLEYSGLNCKFHEKNTPNYIHLPLPLFETFLDEHHNKDSLNFCEPIYDLILIGMDTPRRRGIANHLIKAGLSVYYATNIWGAERYSAIKKARALLNIHAYEDGYLETARLNYCIYNNFPIISENIKDEQIKKIYNGYVNFLENTDLVAEVKEKLLEIRNSRFERWNQREVVVKELNPSLIDKALDDILKLDHPRKNIDLKETYDLDFIKESSVNNGLSLDDIDILYSQIKSSPKINNLLFEYSATLLNKASNFDSDIKTNKVLSTILQDLKSSKIKKHRDLYVTFSSVLNEDIDLNFKNLLMNIEFISGSLTEIIIRKVKKSSNGSLQGYLYDLQDAIINLPVELVANKEVICALISSFLFELKIRGMMQAAYRLSRLGYKNNLFTSGRQVGDYASTFYELGDMLLAIAAAKKTVELGFDPVGILNLSKSKVSKYPKDYLNATEQLKNSFSSQTNALKVYAKIVSNFDLSQANLEHDILPYGEVLHELYDLDVCKLDSIVYASDKLIKFNGKNNLKPQKLLALISHYNESEILLWSIKALAEQGFEIVILDNWSDDVHFHKLEKIAELYSCKVIRFPDQKTDFFDLRVQLSLKAEIAKNYNGYWICHLDADEIRLSSLPGFTLSEVISYADYLGYNAIDHTVLNMRPTNDSFDGTFNPFMSFSFFEYGTTDLHKQIKLWKQGKSKVDLISSGGHAASFLGRKVFPIRQYLFHFPLRNTEQAQNKIFNERLPRFSPEERSMGWHIHYDSFQKNQFKLYEKEALLPLFDFRQLMNSRIIHD